MKLMENRLDPSSLTAKQLRDLGQLTLAALERPALVGRDGKRVQLPEPIFHLLVQVVQAMRASKSIVLLSESESMSTQAAADFLGVSRPFLVNLLKHNVIPHFKVGTHRRVYLRDLLNYQRQRDSLRRAKLDNLRRKVEAAGLYEKTIPTE